MTTWSSDNPCPLGAINDRWEVTGPDLPPAPNAFDAPHDQIRAALTDMVLCGLDGIKSITIELDDGPLTYRRLP